MAASAFLPAVASGSRRRYQVVCMRYAYRVPRGDWRELEHSAPCPCVRAYPSHRAHGPYVRPRRVCPMGAPWHLGRRCVAAADGVCAAAHCVNWFLISCAVPPRCSVGGSACPAVWHVIRGSLSIGWDIRRALRQIPPTDTDPTPAAPDAVVCQLLLWHCFADPSLLCSGAVASFLRLLKRTVLLYIFRFKDGGLTTARTIALICGCAHGYKTRPRR